MRRIGILGLLFICLSFLSVENVFADNTYKISVTPVVERIHLTQSSEAEKKFTVKNLSDSELKFKVYAAPYTALGDKNEIDLESETKYTEIKNWLSFSGLDGAYKKTQTYTLDAKASIDIKYKISVPADVETGGQYAIIFAETMPTNESSGIKNQSRVALKIQGVFDELQEYGAEIGEIKASGLLLGGKLSAGAEVNWKTSLFLKNILERRTKYNYGGYICT